MKSDSIIKLKIEYCDVKEPQICINELQIVSITYLCKCPKCGHIMSTYKAWVEDNPYGTIFKCLECRHEFADFETRYAKRIKFVVKKNSDT